MDTLTTVVSKALDYQSPGTEQTASVIRALREKSMIKEDTLTTDMLDIMANAIDRYHQLLPTGYVGSSLDALVIGLLKSWNVLGTEPSEDGAETTQV